MPRHPSHASRRPASIATTALALIAAGIAGCSSVSDGLSPSRVDYRAKAQPASKLDVPPDLTQLASDPRYQPPTGAAVSANALSSTQPPASVSSPAPIAASVLSGNRIERSGNQRWLVTALTPEQLWPLLRDYWQVNGFALTTDRQDIGLIETDWLENRTRLPQDFLARSISKVFDSVIDSGERDRYRMRVERTAAGTEVSISHRGAMQVVTGERGSEQVRWQPRASDAGLESEMLSRLLVQLSADSGSATAATGTSAKTALTAATAVVAAAPATPARARQD
ncbi:MAG: outer membrane protein assembly factor BamC, partial [Leptothrix sp. (in: b-proteobacteria)]